MASLKLPLCIALRPPTVERRDGISVLVMRTLRPPTSAEGMAVHSFELKNDERQFARELLRRKSNYWLFRSNQRLACGDFVVVDVSSPAPAKRRAFVIDLKQGAPIRVGGGGAGVQLRNAERAICELRAAGVLAIEATYELVTGDAKAMLGFFEGEAGARGSRASRGSQAWSATRPS